MLQNKLEVLPIECLFVCFYNNLCLFVVKEAYRPPSARGTPAKKNLIVRLLFFCFDEFFKIRYQFLRSKHLCLLLVCYRFYKIVVFLFCFLPCVTNFYFFPLSFFLSIQHEIELPQNQRNQENLSASAMKNKKKREAKAKSKQDENSTVSSMFITFCHQRPSAKNV